MPPEDVAYEQVLETYRTFLAFEVRRLLHPGLEAKLDASGLVQQTLLEAHQARENFRGRTVAEVRSWLRLALGRNLQDELRRLGRGPLRERSLDGALDQSSARIAAWIAAEQSPPDGQLLREERVLELAGALAALPEAQRRAVELHHLHGLSVADTAVLLDTSKTAVVGLLHRGREKLRGLLDEAAVATG